MLIYELTDYLETFAPLSYQEDYDNCGLIIGDFNSEIAGVLISLDVTQEVVEEAVKKGCNLIVAHHPIIFKGLKRLNGKNYVEKVCLSAIRNNIAIYAIHTNLDNVSRGVNYKIAERLGLNDVEILRKKKNNLLKLTVFVPEGEPGKLLAALHRAGAGDIGNYSDCSFKSKGLGSFRPNQAANPTIGAKGRLEEVEELKLELILPKYLKNKVLKAMYETHPYEEVAYYLNELENENQEVGFGAIGVLADELSEPDFLKHLKSSMGVEMIKFTPQGKPVRKVAVCGGVGGFLLADAKAKGADAFVSSDFKYHEFFDAEKEILIADIGHFESEVFTKDLLAEIISKKITNFAPHLSEVNTNPVNYYY